jgi:hypothetical protein
VRAGEPDATNPRYATHRAQERGKVRLPIY